MGASTEYNFKLDKGGKWLVKKEIDIACWLQLGVPWHTMQKQDQLQAKLKGQSWDSQCIITENNIHEKPKGSQYGGTATMAFNKITSTISGTGYDKTGLGRWSWIKFLGKAGVTRRVITEYCPCARNLNQPSTVHAQQKYIFYNKI